MGFWEGIFKSQPHHLTDEKTSRADQLQGVSLPTRSQRDPHSPECSIGVSFELEAIEPGAVVTVTPTGFVLSDSASGVVLKRESLTRWGVTNSTDQPISLITPKTRPPSREVVSIVSPGETREGISALTGVGFGGMSFTLPTYGLAPPKLLEPRVPLTTTVPGLEQKGAVGRALFKEFFSAAEAIQREDSESARRKLLGIFEKLDYDVQKDGLVQMSYSYPETILDLIEISATTSKKGERIVAPIFVTPYERTAESAKLPAEFKKLAFCADRLATATLALVCAKELRQELGGPLTRFVRSHPQAGLISPETDAILFLHESGVPLAPLFFRLAPGRGQALKLLRGALQAPHPTPDLTS
jgi:hypothetical protein